MEKKIEMEVNGRIVRIAEHMVEDAERLGATKTKRTVKEPPKELLLGRKIILPKLDLENSPLPEMETTKTADTPEKKTRKQPVRSKSTKV